MATPVKKAEVAGLLIDRLLIDRLLIDRLLIDGFLCFLRR